MMDPNQPTPNSPVQSTQQPFTPQNPSSQIPKFIFIIGGLFILMVGLFGGYYLIKSFSLENQTAEKSKKIQQITTVYSSPTSDPIVNWQTYTNHTLGISFKFPPNWYVIDSGKTDILFIQNYNSTKKPYIDLGDYKITVFYEYQTNLKTLDDLKKRFRTGDTENINIMREFEINGYKALYKEDRPSGGFTFVTVFILDGKGKLVYFELLSTMKEDKNFYDQILSTFKFL